MTVQIEVIAASLRGAGHASLRLAAIKKYIQ